MSRRLSSFIFLFLAPVLIAAFSFSYCGSANAADKIVVGVLCPLTGPYSFEAQSQANFAKLAAEEINAGGGIMGRKVEIVVEDTMLKPGIGVQKARKLIDKGVKYLTGGVSSSVVLGISKVANEAGIIHFGIGGSNTLTGKSCNKHHFNLDTASYQMATGTGSVVVDELGLAKEWYTITADYSWGHSCLGSVKKMLEKRGGKVVGNIMVPLREQDFSSALTKAVASGSPVLGVIVYGSGQGKLLQQALEFGIKKKMKIVVVASDLTVATTTGGDALEGVYLGVPWYWNIQDPVTIALNKRYVKKYGQPAAWPGAQVYDSVKVMAMAMEKAKSFDVAKLIPVLEGMEFRTSKGPEKIRSCDHRAIQEWFVGVGKAPAEMKSKWDVMKIIGKKGGEEIMDPCEETGCNM